MWCKKEKNMFNKYLVFIDLKNAYDKVIHNKLFEKLNKYEKNSKIILNYCIHMQN